MMTRGLEALSNRSNFVSFNPQMSIAFGIPNRFKNVCDGVHSYVRALLDEGCKADPVSDLADFIGVLRRLHQVHLEKAETENRKPPLPLVVHDWFPEKERAEFVKNYMVCWKLSCFKEAISHCNCFEARVNDKRRRHSVAYKNAGGVYTGIDFRASMLPDGKQVPADRVAFPVDDPLAIEAAAEQYDEDDPEAAAEAEQELAEDFAYALHEPGNGSIQMHHDVCKGWKSSYRRQQLEKVHYSKYRARWSRARQRWEKSGVGLLPPRTRRSVEERLALQAKWKQSRNQKLPALALAAGAAVAGVGAES